MFLNYPFFQKKISQKISKAETIETLNNKTLEVLEINKTDLDELCQSKINNFLKIICKLIERKPEFGKYKYLLQYKLDYNFIIILLDKLKHKINRKKPMYQII